MVTEHTLGEVALAQFTETGDVTGLSAWSDQRAEAGDYHGERRLRVLLARDPERRESVRFFMKMSGRRRDGLDAIKAAMGMVRIERWKDSCCEVEWMEDTDYDPNEYDSEGMPDTGYGCVVRFYLPFPARPDAPLIQSLWGITFSEGYDPTYESAHTTDDNSDNNYRRFVEAELAEELFGEVMCLDR